MPTTETVVDFYVEPLNQDAYTGCDWGVFKQSLSYRVGIDDNPDDATAHATRMARYLVNCGRQAQIHVRGRADAPWHTVWCSLDAMPRYPLPNGPL